MLFRRPRRPVVAGFVMYWQMGLAVLASVALVAAMLLVPGVAAGSRGASVLERPGPVGSASSGGRRLRDESVVVTVRGGDL